MSAPAALETAPGGSVAGGRALRRSLRRAERRRLLGNLSLTVPLLAFLLAFFLLPIVAVLTRSVDNSEVSSVLPETAAALRSWDGQGLPAETVFATFAAEAAAAQKAKTLAAVAKRLNNEQSGWRSVVMAAGRGAAAPPDGSWAQALAALDPTWGEPAIWLALQRSSTRYTDLYLLAAVDLERDHALAEQIEDRIVVSLVEDDLAFAEVHLLRQCRQALLVCRAEFRDEGVLLQHRQQAGRVGQLEHEVAQRPADAGRPWNPIIP